MYCPKFDTNMASIPWITGWAYQLLSLLSFTVRSYFQIVPNSLKGCEIEIFEFSLILYFVRLWGQSFKYGMFLGERKETRFKINYQLRLNFLPVARYSKLLACYLLLLACCSLLFARYSLTFYLLLVTFSLSLITFYLLIVTFGSIVCHKSIM